MFPYPSGDGLHLGHYYNYALMDSYCRWQRMKGTEVFQPFGYDAFGLPAENYARKIGGDPEVVTRNNIANFRTQMARMNTLYEEKLITCDPSYVKWTQWIFLRLQERGLAYKSWGEVNWCPSCETVLANEQAKDGKCDRCESTVHKKNLNQWYFKITDYKDRLIKSLDTVDYPASTKKQQKQWLSNLRDWCVSRQRKWGCPIPIDGENETLDTFVDSSFYYLRYLTNSDSEFLPKGCYRPVDLYVGGQEHACMHLIYARFIHMVLYDMGIVPQEEPFNKVIHQGMITSQGFKMSKSKGNSVNPDNYDPNQLRMYLMFLGHYFDGGDWSDRGIIGLNRFFNRVNTWFASVGDYTPDMDVFEKKLDSLVNQFKFNLVVSNFMEFYNKNKNQSLDLASQTRFLKLLNVFAPGFQVSPES
jgi:leucyl-tRNA synthetase